MDILRQVQCQVNQALGHDTLDWRMCNSCAACKYRLHAEPKLTISKQVAIDGNLSLHRVDPSVTKEYTPHTDSCTTNTGIWLSLQEVDVFQYEVKAKKGQLGQLPLVCSLTAMPSFLTCHHSQAATMEGGMLNSGPSDDGWADDNEPGDVTEGSASITVCIDHWKNAGPDQCKHMWQMFIEAGIFLAVC